MSQAQIIYCTVLDKATADKIARHLVGKGLAACCNIIPGLESIYVWKEELHTDRELLLLIKSTEEKYNLIEHAINKLHPYEVPEIIAVDITHGSDPYLQWIVGALEDEHGKSTQTNSGR